MKTLINSSRKVMDSNGPLGQIKKISCVVGSLLGSEICPTDQLVKKALTSPNLTGIAKTAAYVGINLNSESFPSKSNTSGTHLIFINTNLSDYFAQFSEGINQLLEPKFSNYQGP